MRIAVFDPAPAQSDLICQALDTAGHACQPFRRGAELLSHLRRDGCDLLIFNWRLSEPAAADLLRRARAQLAAGAPVLFLTDGADEDEIVAGLDAGGADYLVGPLRRAELVARVQAQLRRAYPARHGGEQFECGRYLFHIRPERAAHERPGRLLRDGAALDVTHKEFQLALLFFRNLGRPLSRAYIQEAVWPHDQAEPQAEPEGLPSRTLDTHVSRVRNKLGLKPENGFRLAPVYSYGYRLEQLGA